jgi:transcriptional regulator with XRE-family HTH domain
VKTTYTRKYETLLARLKTARKQAGVTQQELAKRLGKPQSFISKYENAERRLDVVEFLEVTRALRINACTLLEALSEEIAPRLAASEARKMVRHRSRRS